MSLERKHLAVHVEKTAGTSITHLFSSLYGPARVFVYEPRLDAAVRMSETINGTSLVVDRIKQLLGQSPLLPLVRRLYYKNLRHKTGDQYKLDNLPSDFDVLCGHFVLGQCIEYFYKPITTIVLRQPFDRMWSHYQHWKRLLGQTNFRTNPPFTSEMDFETFALLPQLRNYQTQAMSGRTLSSFNLIGTTENLNTFPAQLCQLLNRRGFSVELQRNYDLRRFNQSPATERPNFGHDFLHRFQDFHALDYENYKLANELVLSPPLQI